LRRSRRNISERAERRLYSKGDRTKARAITGVVAGVVVWILIATVGNLAVRAAWPGYAEVEAAMKFTPEMMMTGISGSRSFTCLASSVPVPPGMS